MRRFFGPVIQPLLEAFRPARIIEIGADDGGHTRRLARWCRKRNVHLDSIDPVPGFDVAEMESTFSGSLTVHVARSLDVLAALLPADVVLIDGDHNWYTVYHELQTLFGDGELPASAPVVVCHDVCWPYGRRDLYYDIESIPPSYRQPAERKGIRPGSSALLEPGLNKHLLNAAAEGGARNGVRTAIEDALAPRRDQVRVVWLEILYGLGIIVPLARLRACPAAEPLLASLALPSPWKTLAAIAELERVYGDMARQQVEGPP